MADCYKPKFIRWYESRFRASDTVDRMTKMQRLLYRALLQAAFHCKTCPYLPADDAELEYLSGAPDHETWIASREGVLAAFETTAHGLSHPLLLDEYGAYKNCVERLERNKGSGHLRSSRTAPPPMPAASGFGVFWDAYPRKTAKGAALKAWLKLNPDAELQQKILAAVEVQKHDEQWTKDRGRFIPHPATWLNQTRWDDEQTLQLTATESKPRLY